LPAPAVSSAAGGLSWQQRRAVVDAACVGLAALAPCFGSASQWDVLAALWPAVQQAGTLAQSRTPRHVSYALLRAAADAAAAAAAAMVLDDGADACAAAEAPPPELASALPPLVVSYLLACAADGALSVPPDIALRCADADDPGVETVAALLAACPSLMAASVAALADAARVEPVALPDCTAVLAALVARTELHAALLHAKPAVEAAAAALAADAPSVRMPHSSVVRHLRVALRQLFGHE
jgi:hypothetical protein